VGHPVQPPAEAGSPTAGCIYSVPYEKVISDTGYIQKQLSKGYAGFQREIKLAAMVDQQKFPV